MNSKGHSIGLGAGVRSLIAAATALMMTCGPSFGLSKETPFKCTTCGGVKKYAARELKQKGESGQMTVTKGLLTMTCSVCGKNTLTLAVECVKCQNLFVVRMASDDQVLDDRCTKCGVSYATAWQEKYRKNMDQAPKRRLTPLDLGLVAVVVFGLGCWMIVWMRRSVRKRENG